MGLGWAHWIHTMPNCVYYSVRRRMVIYSSSVSWIRNINNTHTERERERKERVRERNRHTWRIYKCDGVRECISRRTGDSFFCFCFLHHWKNEKVKTTFPRQPWSPCTRCWVDVVVFVFYGVGGVNSAPPSMCVCVCVMYKYKLCIFLFLFQIYVSISTGVY